ncbi:glycosyltransferase family 2 protein [Riemerella columbipharyngis]|uniref:Glycosyltransferase, GT2 family n=1 Tax=Riemerella columbipharyngis TaxID=1071918 RepID=A0A1G6YQM2_9FLAO|nr:glycosyltransferase family 2 protein [Riemerella columbipharyngis]SDD91957.1 Glycosyltransferase, GT2 family [Riemerella columbipharyngis]
MKTAIAILNWNGKSWIEQFLPFVVKYSSEADIYIIDNGSTDDSVSFIRKHFPMVKVIINDKNYGFAGGYNVGLKNIQADIFCLINSDVKVTENWLSPIIALFEKDQSIAAAQPKILSFTDKNTFEFAGAAGGFLDNLGYPYCRGRVFDEVEEDKGQYDDETEIFWASGCCFFIRAKDFFEQNGFDERFFAHQEEIDLCWRLINNGKKIYYTHLSTVYHVGGGTLSKQSPQKTYLNFRNNLSMMLKNLPKNKLWIIFPRLCLDGIAGIYFGLKNGLPHLWAVVRAHFAFYGQAKESYKRRGSRQTKKYYHQKWLIWKHYIRKN